jgi:tetratricopeptide (TPR) repeat protein
MTVPKNKFSLILSALTLTILIGCTGKTSSSDKTLEQANQQLSAGHPQKAILLLENARIKGIESPSILESLAFIYNDQNQPEKAAPLFEKLNQLKPEQPEILLYAAAAYSSSDLPDEVIRVYQQYLKIMPQDATVWTQLGEQWVTLKESENALSAYHQAYQLNPTPDIAKIIENLGGRIAAEPTATESPQSHTPAPTSPPTPEPTQTAIKQPRTEPLPETRPADQPIYEDKESAVSMAERLLGIPPPSEVIAEEKDPQSLLVPTQNPATAVFKTEGTWLQEAETAFAVSNFIDAIAAFKQALLINSDNAATWNGLSSAFLKNKEFEWAAAAALEAMRREPKELRFRMSYLNAIQNTMTHEAFRGELLSARQDFPEAPEVTLELALYYRDMEDNVRNARLLLNEIMQQHPTFPRIDEIKEILAMLPTESE